MSDTVQSRLPTTLGPEARLEDGTWVLDLGELPIFHGLSVLSRALGEMVAAQTRGERPDIAVERAVRPTENPELAGVLGVAQVKLVAEQATVAAITKHPELFQDHLRTILGTIQRPRYRDALLPEAGRGPCQALVFRLAFPELACRFVLERVAASKDPQRCALRITVEDPGGRRLDLTSLPHVEVSDLDRRVFIAGSTRIAQTLAEGIRREAERGRRAFVELRRPHSHLFRQLDKAGLASFQQVHVGWADTFVAQVLEDEPTWLDHLLKRVLLALEDVGVRRLLEERHTLRIDCESASVWVDASQLQRVLNLSLGGPRDRVAIDWFLARMPTLAGLVTAAGKGGGERPLADVSIFLVHHMTSEVLGLIAALRQLGCRDLFCLFVAYAGDPPGSYLGPLLELPADEFACAALAHVPEAGHVAGHYKLSRQYSELDDAAELTAALEPHGRDWLGAMRAVAMPRFLRQLAAARDSGRHLLVVEDGGYLAPLLNEACLTGRRLCDLQAGAGERPVAEALRGVLVGSVEHTRNGFDRLAAIEAEHGSLAWPAFSIAISRHKVQVESEEVARSVLNAIENVLHASGRVLSRRGCLVLGSRGAIGSRLMGALAGRLNRPADQLWGVDLRAATSARFPETTRWADLPRPLRLRTDLVIGVTGDSVLTGDELAEWLVESEVPELVLASGSTKTIEFSGLAAWVEDLLRRHEPQVRGQSARIAASELYDPLTGRVFGHRYRFALPGDRRRDVVFLANLTPVNFMFYGVPTELIDEVLGELLAASLGLLRRAQRETVPCRLFAVDRDITAHGEPLARPVASEARS
jgi:hypothetical protein